MKMSIFAFTLAVALAAGSAYSEMTAMGESAASTAGKSDVRLTQDSRNSDDARRQAAAAAPEKKDQGY